nr:immunoglobulin light chain junction region [Macaca mulatta]MOW56747.1 immunoglobulin light chain junction region [Macaca mulatta]MOW57356.1 immunoglobulin light chain junction region [Macaca mulatta]MOW57948.1 immunoglobulin light chain junction region [Macaca mulatta]MOW58253.1 immunoglobulin light chain junction region [Macaca mulatta]
DYYCGSWDNSGNYYIF